MVGVAEDDARDMGHGQTDESYGAAEGCDGTCKERCREEYYRARAAQVEPHRASVVLTQKQHVE